MKKIAGFMIFALAFAACDKIEEAKNDAIGGALEKAIKKETGVDVDLPDVGKIEKNAGSLTLKLGDKVVYKGDDKMKGTITFNKDKNQDTEVISISFQTNG